MREDRKEKEMVNSLKEEFLRSQDEKGQSTAFSFLDLEKYALPLLKEAGVEEAELDLRLLLQEAFSLDTKDYLLGKRDAVFTLYRKRAEEKPALSSSRVTGDLALSSSADEEPDSALNRFFSFLEKRLHRIPLSQILGRQEFFGLSFLVNENVLSPRQDTECIVERILEEEEKWKSLGEQDKRSGKKKELTDESVGVAGCEALSILDLCTGSGCIGLTLAKNLHCKTVLLLDKSDKALEVAKENYRRLFLEQESAKEEWKCSVLSSGREPDPNRIREQGLNPSVHFLESDLFDALPSFMEEKGISAFDILVSNPPYIRRDVIETLDAEVALHEPVLALDGGGDGLDFYRRIAKEGKRFLLPGGRVYLEIGYDQGESVKSIFQKEGYREVEVFPDYEGRDRGLYATLQLDTNKTIHYY